MLGLDRLHPVALLVMRIVLGAIMVAHGYHKVFGGLHAHAQVVAGLGFPGWMGYLSACTEFFGGLLVLIGLLTRFAAFAIAINMAVAVLKVHLHHGLTGQGGFEYPLALFAMAFALIFFGGGSLALDRMFRFSRTR